MAYPTILSTVRIISKLIASGMSYTYTYAYIYMYVFYKSERRRRSAQRGSTLGAARWRTAQRNPARWRYYALRERVDDTRIIHERGASDAEETRASRRYASDGCRMRDDTRPTRERTSSEFGVDEALVAYHSPPISRQSMTSLPA